MFFDVGPAPQPYQIINIKPTPALADSLKNEFLLEYDQFIAAIKPFMSVTTVNVQKDMNSGDSSWSDPNGAGPQLHLLNSGKYWQPSGAGSGIIHYPAGVVQTSGQYGRTLGTEAYDNQSGTLIDTRIFTNSPSEWWTVNGDLSALLGMQDTNHHAIVTYVRDGKYLVPVDMNRWDWSHDFAPLYALLAFTAITGAAMFLSGAQASAGAQVANAAASTGVAPTDLLTATGNVAAGSAPVDVTVSAVHTANVLTSTLPALEPATATALGQVAASTAATGGSVSSAISSTIASTGISLPSSITSKIIGTVATAALSTGSSKGAATVDLLNSNYDPTVYTDPYSGYTTGDPTQYTATVVPYASSTTGDPTQYTSSSADTGAGWTYAGVVSDITSAARSTLQLLPIYNMLVGKTPVSGTAFTNPAGATVTPSPNGTLITRNANGTLTVSPMPVGQLYTFPDGSSVVNNGDGTYTRISADGSTITGKIPGASSKSTLGVGMLAALGIGALLLMKT